MQAILERAPAARAKRQIFIVEDHPVFRQGLAQIINSEPDLRVCGQAGDAETAISAVRKLKPDLVLVDISLPGKNGLELIKELRIADRQIKLLVVSMHDEALYAGRVLRAGGDGYIMKQEDPEEVVHAIRDVLAGHLYVSEEVLAVRRGSKPNPSESTKRPLKDLTDQELEILELIGQGKSNGQIANELQLTISDVIGLGNDIRKKLNLARAKDLLRYAVCWVETGDA